MITAADRESVDMQSGGKIAIIDASQWRADKVMATACSR